MKQTIIKTGIRTALLASAAVVAVSPGAFAQGTAAPETVVVTGSLIRQQGLVSPSPLNVLTSQEIQAQGTVNIENMLNNLPQVFADQGGAASNAASGTASVDLRDLGPQRTLVLIDGTRLMPGDPDALSHATGGVADLNVIPAALVDHVEVLTGGASATYGSDAVAGVVNFIMRKDFEGVEVDGQLSIAETANDKFQDLLTSNDIPLPQKDLWDGRSGQFTVLLGSNSANGRGNITAYATYENIKAIVEADRDYSACSTGSNYNSTLGNYSGGFNCIGSSTIPQGRFIAVDRNAAGLPGSSGFTATTGRTFAPYAGQTFNFAPYNYVQRPDTRYTMGAMGHYQLNDMFDFYTSLMFMDDHTVAALAPGGAFQTPFLINCNNPVLSAQQISTICPGTPSLNGTGLLTPGSAATATILIGRRAVESGPRLDDLRHEEYRIVLGDRGDLGGGWSYDIYAQYGTTTYADNQEGYWSASRLQNALLVVNSNGVPTCQSVLNNTDVNCVPIDIFAAPTITGQTATTSSLTPAMLNYVSVNGVAIGETTEQIVHGAITGDLGGEGFKSGLAENPVAVAFGGELRKESLTYTPDVLVRSGDLLGLGGPRPPSHGSFNVGELFGEIDIPIAQNQTYAKDLTFNAGYRYSDYNTIGGTNTWKLGLEWQPLDDVKFRGSIQRAVRAPNVTDLFTPTAVILFGGSDPCGNNSRTNAPPSHSVDAFCQNTGLTNFGTGLPGDKRGQILPCPASQCQQEISGNKDLKAETSDTHSVGIVFTPTFFQGFTATIDYFDIKIDDVIGTYGAAFLLSACQSGNLNACSDVHRDPVTGYLWVGQGYVVNFNNNLGFTKTNGIDVELNYGQDVANWGWGENGRLSFNLVGTWTNHLQTEPIPPGNPFYQAPGVYDCAGLFGLTCSNTLSPVPKWRHKLRVTWDSPWDFGVSLAWRYIDSVKFDGNDPNPLLNIGTFDANDAKIPAFNYFDLSANWSVLPNVQLRAGVNNIFDKDPPVIDTSNIGISAPPFGNGNTFPQLYDSLGRLFFVAATVKY